MRRLIALAAVCAFALAGCTTAQVDSAFSTAETYQNDVVAACKVAEAAEVAAAPFMAVPAVASAANLVTSSCSTEEQLAALFLSPTSKAWVETLTTTLKSGGKVVPPPPASSS